MNDIINRLLNNSIIELDLTEKYKYKNLVKICDK
jgi:hypothetical protein